MVMTASTMVSLGSKAPDFSLQDVISGETISKESFVGKPLLAMFICAHCPFVVHVEEQLAALSSDYFGKLGIVGISANDVATHPGDAPENLKAQAERLGFQFPYLYDATQEVAKAYTAACTPDFFLFDSSHALVYRGQLDSSRPGNQEPVTGSDLRVALDAVLEGNDTSAEQTPSIGCNIKWKAGNEPEYFG